MDALEISNTEHHAVWTQLEGVRQGLQIVNGERHAVWAQLEGIHQGIEYLAGMVWKLYAVNCRSLTSGQGEGSNEEATR